MVFFAVVVAFVVGAVVVVVVISFVTVCKTVVRVVVSRCVVIAKVTGCVVVVVAVRAVVDGSGVSLPPHDVMQKTAIIASTADTILFFIFFPFYK